jgi:hypothetical protein
MDSGFTNPTVWLWLAVDEDGTIVVFDEYYQAGKNVAEHSQVVNERSKRILQLSGQHDFFLTTGDPAIKQTKEHTGTSIQFEYGKFGIHIAVDQIPSDRRVGLEKLQQYLKMNPKTGKPYLMITDDCPQLIAELPKLKWKKHASVKVAEQKNKLEDIRDKDNHCYDALKYAMTFMDDLTPDREQLNADSRKFHDTFRSTFTATEKFSEYDEGGWAGWSVPSITQQFEG